MTDCSAQFDKKLQNYCILSSLPSQPALLKSLGHITADALSRCIQNTLQARHLLSLHCSPYCPVGKGSLSIVKKYIVLFCEAAPCDSSYDQNPSLFHFSGRGNKISLIVWSSVTCSAWLSNYCTSTAHWHLQVGGVAWWSQLLSRYGGHVYTYTLWFLSL